MRCENLFVQCHAMMESLMRVNCQQDVQILAEGGVQESVFSEFGISSNATRELNIFEKFYTEI